MSRVNRLSRILRVVIHNRLDELLDTVDLQNSNIPRRYRLMLRYSPLRLLPAPKDSAARRLRLTLETLGPVFIKFGQLLSTRRDLLPEDYANELALLQDQVPPFSGLVARAIVVRELGCEIEEIFKFFDESPLASASVAQVHAATLLDGSEVVVKVIRPDVDRVIAEDIKLLHTIAKWLHSASTEARRLRLPEVVADYENTIFDELDLNKEAANTIKLRTNFSDSPALYVPKIYPCASSKQVLTLEHIHGVPIAQVDELKRRGTNMKVLADRGVETFFTQVFVHNFFHADMHPGNIFVDVTDPESPRYIAIDCAIMGTLTYDDQNYLARNLLAFFNQDYAEVARLHLESGWVPEDTQAAEFERVIRDACEPIFAKPLNEISFGEFLITLFQTARQFNMEVQPQLVLLQKTLLNIEGLGRQLYPELDLWETAKPFMEQWIQEKIGPLAAIRAFSERAPDLLSLLPQLPDLIINATREIKRVDRLSQQQEKTIKSLNETLQSQHKRAKVSRLTGAALIAAATFLLWAPIAESLQRGESISTVAGLLAALVGSMLIVRS